MELNEMIALAVSAAVTAAFAVYLGINEKERVTEWLRYAVTYAEKLLGSKTGQIKLRVVYDMFCGRFPLIAAILPFRVFSAWVDTALETLGDMLTAENGTEEENGDIHG